MAKAFGIQKLPPFNKRKSGIFVSLSLSFLTTHTNKLNKNASRRWWIC